MSSKLISDQLTGA